MKKMLVLLSLCLAFGLLCLPAFQISAEAATDVEINETNFPDNVFRRYVKDYFDTNGDDKLSQSEIDLITSIVFGFYYDELGEVSRASSLQGIEFFTSLKRLEVWDASSLSSLDVSRNTTLEVLLIAGAFESSISSLDLSNNTVLESLRINLPRLESLDISHNLSLKSLYIGALNYGPSYGESILTSLDVSSNTALEYLHITGAQLTSLDVSRNTALTTLECGGNQLTSLDVSNNTALTYLGCADNQLTALNVSHNTALEELLCYGNTIYTLDISDCPGLITVVEEGKNVLSTDSDYGWDSLIFIGHRYTPDETKPWWNEKQLLYSPTTTLVTQKQGVQLAEDGNYYLYIGGKIQTSYNGLYQHTDGKTYYIVNGIAVSGWQFMDEKWYYFAPSGEMAIGWQLVGEQWYYLASGGAMQTGWQHVGGNWYYLSSSGAMQIGWQYIDGYWYYLAPGGAMQTGWKYIDGYWYYLASSGAMQKGWQTINGKTYYFHPSGAMASLEYINGWWLGSDGSWTYPYQATWRWGSKGWWYGDESGWYAQNATYKIDGKSYTFDSSGWMK